MAAVTWVRNPWWDGFWLLSGFPIGIALMLFVPNPNLMPLLITIMILETGHLVSPIILAWSKPGLRAIVCREWEKLIIAPGLLMVGCVLLPLWMVIGVYFAWNIYHFGMQIFGVTCLYLRPASNDERLLWALGCLTITVLGMGVFPFIGEGPKVAMLTLGIFSFNHWLTDIGLSSQVSGWRWGFISLVLAIGVAWLLLRGGPLTVRNMPQILAVRFGLGMIHFVYSARIWKVSDPRVRATIGKALCFSVFLLFCCSAYANQQVIWTDPNDGTTTSISIPDDYTRVFNPPLPVAAACPTTPPDTSFTVPSSVVVAGSFDIRLDNISGLTPTAWVAISETTAPDGDYSTGWFYLHETEAFTGNPSCGLSFVRLAFPAPTAAGNYEVRLHLSDSAPTSLRAPITVVAP